MHGGDPPRGQAVTVLDSLQWIGFILIVAGYWRFGSSKVQGGAISFLGSVPLAIWAFQVSAWGVLALQLACLLMNAKTIYDGRREGLPWL
jgi:hypothetical protein